MGKRKKKNHIEDDFLKINKKINREIELERNGGRWIAVDRPWKNKKHYDRKRDRIIDLNDSCLSFSLKRQKINPRLFVYCI